MHPLTRLIGFGLRQIIGEAVGDSAVQVATFVQEHFNDHTQELPRALARANDRSWQALRIALAGDGILDWVKGFVADGDVKSIREQVGRFLESNAAHFGNAPAKFRKDCLAELKEASKAGLLSATHLSVQDLGRETADFRRLAEPEGQIEGAWQAVASTADNLPPQYSNLARLLRQRPPAGPPLLVAVFAHFFRREFVTNAELFRGRVFDNLRQLSTHQAAGFAEVESILNVLGDRFDQVMDQVLEQLGRIEAKLDALPKAFREAIRDELHAFAEQHHVRPNDISAKLVVSADSDAERAFIKRAREEFRKRPELQGADDQMLLGDCLAAAGLFKEAKEAHADAARAAAQVQNRVQEAQAHFKAYRNACEAAVATGAAGGGRERHWADAMQALLRAVELDPTRFTPFPLHDYRPQCILGAGGFGTVFHCRDLVRNQDVAVKALYTADLARTIKDVFNEAEILARLKHPALIGVKHWGYADSELTRPYIVMEYFPGVSLKAHLDKHGVLLPADLLAVARQVAAAMQQAHQAGVWHRDLKPDNVLVRKTGAGWEVKIIDFGLAVRPEAITTSASKPSARRTSQEQSWVGTYEYAPPEQKRRLPGVKVGPYSDVYTFGKTCCEALFQTSDPRSHEFDELPPEYKPLATLLDSCIAPQPNHRPQDFAAVLKELEALEGHTRHLKAAQLALQQEKLTRLHQEGEPKLTELLRAIHDRSQGKPTKADNAEVTELCWHYRLPRDRATAILNQVRKQWHEARLQEDGLKKKPPIAQFAPQRKELAPDGVTSAEKALEVAQFPPTVAPSDIETAEALRLECPQCRQSARVPSTMAGHKVKCPNCGASLGRLPPTSTQPTPSVFARESILGSPNDTAGSAPGNSWDREPSSPVSAGVKALWIGGSLSVVILVAVFAISLSGNKSVPKETAVFEKDPGTVTPVKLPEPVKFPEEVPPGDKADTIKWTLEKLGPGGGSDFSRLVQARIHEDPKMRSAVEKALLAYADLFCRNHAARLGRSDVDALVSLLKSGESAILQAFAIEAVTRLGPQADQAVTALVKITGENRDAKTLSCVLVALKRIGVATEETLTVFQTHLTDPDDGVKDSAATALLLLGRKWMSWNQVVELISSSNDEVRKTAKELLREKLANVAPKDLPALRQGLQHRNREARIVFIVAISSLKDEARDAAPDLAKDATDANNNKELRLSALDALVAIGGDKPASVSVEALKKALQDADLGIRKFAVRPLATMGTKDAFAALGKALLDEQEQSARRQIVESLAKESSKLAALKGEDHAPVLIKALIYALQQQKLEFNRDPWKEFQRADENLRRAQTPSIRFGGGVGINMEEVQKAKALYDRAYLKALNSDLEIFKAECDKAGVFVTALSAMGKRAVTDLKDRLPIRKDESPLVRWVAARALGEIGPDAKVAIPDLTLSKNNRNELSVVREAADQAIKRITAAPHPKQ